MPFMAKELQKDFFLRDLFMLHCLAFPISPFRLPRFFLEKPVFRRGGLHGALSCSKIHMLRLHFPVPHLAKLTIYFPLSENRVSGKETSVYLWCTFPISPGRPSSPFLHQPHPIYRPLCTRRRRRRRTFRRRKKGCWGSLALW